MTDRLEQIRNEMRSATYYDRKTGKHEDADADIDWLIAEVDRLRAVQCASQGGLCSYYDAGLPRKEGA